MVGLWKKTHKFGSKHDVVADVRRLSLAHEAPRHPSATFALVLVVPHP